MSQVNCPEWRGNKYCK